MNKALTIVLLSFFLVPEARSQDTALELPLSGQYVSLISVTGGPWLATEPGQQVNLIFTADGLVDVKQFDFLVRLDPPEAFDITGAIFRTDNPFLNPFPGGVDLLSDTEIKMGAAILGTSVVNGERILGTLSIPTSETFTRSQPARLVIQSFSVGPSSFDRDTYGETDLELSIVVSDAPVDPTVVDVGSWGSVKALQDEEEEGEADAD